MCLELWIYLVPLLIIGAEWATKPCLVLPVHQVTATKYLRSWRGLKDNIQNERRKILIFFCYFILAIFSAGAGGARWLRDNERGEMETNGPVFTSHVWRTGWWSSPPEGINNHIFLAMETAENFTWSLEAALAELQKKRSQNSRDPTCDQQVWDWLAGCWLFSVVWTSKTQFSLFSPPHSSF